MGHGIADLVLIRGSRINQRHVELRKSYRQLSPLLKEEYFRTLNVIPDQPGKASLDLIVKKTHLSKPYLKYSILRTLEKKGYIKSNGENHYFKINGWVPLTSELIAVEAKLKDWKRGLIQANRYKIFANKVYLAIPSSHAHLVDRKMLRKHGIGLITLDIVSGKKNIPLRASHNIPANLPRSNFAVEHFWGKQIYKRAEARPI